jgi:predicted transcriptional regulator
MYFTQKEEEFANILIDLGMKRNVAKVLVYLANTDEATSRNIERGTDLRQPEVSIAMGGLIDKKWVAGRESKSESKGRRSRFTSSLLPIEDIMDSIEIEKKKEATNS